MELAVGSHIYNSGIKEAEAGVCDSKPPGCTQDLVIHLSSLFKNMRGKQNPLIRSFQEELN